MPQADTPGGAERGCYDRTLIGGPRRGQRASERAHPLDGVRAGRRSSLKLVEQERGLLGAVDRAQAQAALRARKGPSAALAGGPAARAPTRAANVSTASSSSAALSHSGGSAANTAEAQEEDCTAPEGSRRRRPEGRGPGIATKRDEA